MPIYEYLCEKCEREFEVEQRITEDPIKTCRFCKSRKVKRLISQTSFVLKGGGWYNDLYSSSSGDSKDADTSSSDTGSAKDSSSDSSSKKKSKSGKSDSSGKKGGKKKGGKAAA